VSEKSETWSFDLKNRPEKSTFFRVSNGRRELLVWRIRARIVLVDLFSLSLSLSLSLPERKRERERRERTKKERCCFFSTSKRHARKKKGAAKRRPLSLEREGKEANVVGGRGRRIDMPTVWSNFLC
jgi:hypothetical protein